MSHLDKKEGPWARYVARLVGARLAVGMTQSALALACGKKGNSWISMMETGQNSWPKELGDLAILAEALDVPTEWLLYGRKFGSENRVAIGAGGPDVLLEERDPEADVAFYPGTWLQGPGGPDPFEMLLVDFNVKALPMDGPPMLLALDKRGHVVIGKGLMAQVTRPGKPDATYNPRTVRRLVDANHEYLSDSPVVGKCVQLKPMRAPSRPRRAK